MSNEQPGTPAFYVSNEAWYAEAVNRAGMRGAAEIMIGRYADEGGCDFEFAIRWIDLGRTIPRLEVFDDAWGVFADPDFSGFVAWLASHTALYGQESVTPADVSAFLLSAGFIDRTQRTNPDAGAVVKEASKDAQRADMAEAALHAELHRRGATKAAS
jgi:hypothetical protein